jgi:hypothetical protein
MITFEWGNKNMESGDVKGPDNAPEGWKRPKIFWTAVLSFFVVVMLISSVYLIRISAHGPDYSVLEEYNEFSFIITQNDDGNITNTSGEVMWGTMGDDTYGMTTSWFPLSNGLDLQGKIFPTVDELSAWGGTLGYYACNHELNTTFGQKMVSTYYSSSEECMVIREVGIESGVIYLTSYLKENYSLTIKMNDTINEKVWDADSELLPFTFSDEYSHVIYGSAPTYWSNAYEHRSMWGMIEIRNGDELKYRLNGTTIAVYFLDVLAIKSMEESGNYYFDPEKSTMMGDGEDFWEDVTSGHYLYLIVHPGSAEDVWIKPYWEC